MTPEDFLYPALDKYCEWLNHWTVVDGPDHHTYEPDQFMVGDGISSIRGMIPTGSSTIYGRWLVEMTVSDGDDGGPTDLTVWFEEDDEGKYVPWAIVQGFDTNLQFIMEEGLFKNLPEERTP